MYTESTNCVFKIDRTGVEKRDKKHRNDQGREKAEFDADIARRKKLGIRTPGEDRDPYVRDLNGPDHMQVIAAEFARRGQP